MKLGHAIGAGVAIAAAAFAAGWLAHRPAQPQVELHDLRGYESDGADQVHVVQTSGPVRVVTRTVTKPAPGCVGPEVEQVVTEDRGQVVTDTQREDEQHVVEVERTDLKVTSAAPPGWAVSVGVDDALGARQLHLALRRRLFGPFWLEASGNVARRELGAGVAMEW